MTGFLYTTNDLNIVKFVDFFKTMFAYFEKKITTVMIEKHVIHWLFFKTETALNALKST